MIKTQEEAWKYLSSLIMSSQPFRKNPEFPFRRAKYLLELLGNPQDKLKVIHIAGTSGKGSTAYYMSRLLAEHGFRVGLHISPHLLDIRERFQIGNSFISNGTFIRYLNKIKTASGQMSQTEFGPASYFEALVALSYLLFYEKRVDYAVMETGMGGWHDATNTVNREDKLCVITSIGLDHTRILGKTLSQIAMHKAKIIRHGNLAVVQAGPRGVKQVIDAVARQEQATVQYLEPGNNLTRIRLINNRVRFDFRAESAVYKDIEINSPALYQAHNAAEALLSLTVLAKRDGFKAEEDKIRSAFSGPSLAGRMDLRQVKGKTVLFDGAHNPQKMRALLKSLSYSFPGQKFHFLVAFKKGKNFQDMMRLVDGAAEDVHITNFLLNVQDSSHMPEDPFEIAAYSGLVNAQVPVRVVVDPFEALDAALAHISGDDMLVVTGSLYLLSSLYTKV